MKRLLSEKIASIIGDKLLASAIHRSVASALECPFVHLFGGKTVWDVFEHSLDTALLDIEEHPRGKLFRRLIEYGPHYPDDPEVLVSNGETTLSDPECGLCVDFIFSHMVNRFRGELAELLALEPCVTLVQRLQQEGYLPSDVHLYWGNTVQERRQTRIASEEHDTQWGSFTKGADGVLVELMSTQRGGHHVLKVHGVIEVKSMPRSSRRVIDQINKHVTRLCGGVKLGDREWSPDDISCSSVIRVMVLPATWRLSREWQSMKTNGRMKMVFAKPSEPPVQTQVEELEPDLWKITLAWSQEALSEAAYEMTFWYMSQVGRHVYTGKPMPKGWEYMTPEEAGYNAIKMMLYYILLRHISKRQMRHAVRLYNVYSYGYPIGADNEEMLWPDPDEDEMAERNSDNWRDFQEKVAGLFRQIPGCRAFVDYTVNGSRIGKVKVDVLVEFRTQQERRFGIRGYGFVFKVIVECKYWKKRIPQEKVFALKTIVEDTGAAMGILVTEVGVQSGAEKYLTSAVNLQALTFTELQSFIQGMYVGRCPECGQETLLLFDPKGRQAFCRECYAKQKRY